MKQSKTTSDTEQFEEKNKNHNIGKCIIMTEFIVSNDVKNISSPREEKEKMNSMNS